MAGVQPGLAGGEKRSELAGRRDEMQELRRCLEIFADQPDEILTWKDVDSFAVASAVRVCAFLRRARAGIYKRFF
jgi:hypothetical protein